MVSKSLARITAAVVLAVAGIDGVIAQGNPFVPKNCVLRRPNIVPYPYSPGLPHAVSPPRDPNKLCIVPALGNGEDDAPAILAAFHRCNNGGTVLLNNNYTILSPLDLTFLQSVDVAISGIVNFGTNITQWVATDFKYTYQTSSTMWRFGGEDVNIYGGDIGTINGNGQVWWDANALNSSLLRPILFVVDGLNHGTVSHLNFKNPPNWFNLIANSSDVYVSNMNLNAVSTDSHAAANSDGWDIYRSDNIVIQDSIINNDDDCVSFKPNATNVVVQGLSCNGSHGISVGSLGQYLYEFDIVENVYVYNISMSNASDGARIKVWPGIQTSFQPLLNGGGGQGYVNNVTYDVLHNTNNDWAIELTQCYGQSNLTLCNLYPSNLTIENVLFKNMWGTTSKKYDPKVGTLVCSTPTACKNIQAHNISITPPSGKTAQWVCTNVNDTLLDINCIPS